MELPGYGVTFQCPYNKAHQLHKGRVQTHLIKCRKNHPNVPKVTCPFNVTHLLNQPELALHVADCPDRASFDRYKYSVQSGAAPKPEPTPNQVNFDAVEADEDWDDINVPTYDPQKYVRNAPVIRTLNLAPPAQRAAFREQEMLRLNELKLNRADPRVPGNRSFN